MGDSDDESSNYTESSVSEREEDNISEMATVHQNGSMIVVPNVDGLDDYNINVALK